MTNENAKTTPRASKKTDVRKLTRIAILAAIVVVLQLLSNAGILKFGPVEINLALIPIALGAILYGPLTGAFLGALDGILILIAAGTQAFLVFNPIATVLLCLLKTGIAGFVSGVVYKALSRFNIVIASIPASLVVPVCNTGLFMIGVLTIFRDLFAPAAEAGGMSMMQFVIVSFLTTNFLIEIIVTIILIPVITTLVKMFKKN